MKSEGNTIFSILISFYGMENLMMKTVIVNPFCKEYLNSFHYKQMNQYNYTATKLAFKDICASFIIEKFI